MLEQAGSGCRTVSLTWYPSRRRMMMKLTTKGKVQCSIRRLSSTAERISEFWSILYRVQHHLEGVLCICSGGSVKIHGFAYANAPDGKQTKAALLSRCVVSEREAAATKLSWAGRARDGLLG
jgi:hypothetical protein